MCVISEAPAAKSNFETACAAAPAPEITIFISLIFFSATESAFKSAARTTIAVPCRRNQRAAASAASKPGPRTTAQASASRRAAAKRAEHHRVRPDARRFRRWKNPSAAEARLSAAMDD